MAPGPSVKKNQNRAKKNRSNKINLVFDATKRREFLTGFHKRKLQRKKEAQEKLERELKEERKRLKHQAKESYKKLVVSHKPLPEFETLLKEEYEEDSATVRIEELSTNTIAQHNNWIGTNQVTYDSVQDDSDEENEEVPGMELSPKKRKKEEKNSQKFYTERDVKRLLKKEATKKVKKSKVFQMKNKIEKQKQKKKSLQVKKQKIKFTEKRTRRHH